MQILFFALIIFLFFCVWRVLRKIRQRRWFGALKHLIFILASLILLLICGYLLLNLHFLQRLSQPKPVAVISFDQQTDHNFKATVVLPTGVVKTFVLTGNVWQLSAKVLIWHKWLRYLGLTDRYQLDALRSYSNDFQQIHQKMTVYRVSKLPDNDLWRWGQQHVFKRWFVKTVYGSAVYMPMVNRARYKVEFNHTSLIALPLNAVAKQSIGLQ